VITGSAGRWGPAAAAFPVTVAFVQMDTGGSSAGLEGLAAGGGRNAALAPFYAAASRSYPAFVSLVLLPALWAAVTARLPALVRAGAALTLAGALAAIASVPASFAPEVWSAVRQLVNFSAVIGYVLGLLAFWFSGRIPRRRGNAPATFRKK